MEGRSLCVCEGEREGEKGVRGRGRRVRRERTKEQGGESEAANDDGETSVDSGFVRGTKCSHDHVSRTTLMPRLSVLMVLPNRSARVALFSQASSTKSESALVSSVGGKEARGKKNEWSRIREKDRARPGLSFQEAAAPYPSSKRASRWEPAICAVAAGTRVRRRRGRTSLPTERRESGALERSKKGAGRKPPFRQGRRGTGRVDKWLFLSSSLGPNGRPLATRTEAVAIDGTGHRRVSRAQSWSRSKDVAPGRPGTALQRARRHSSATESKPLRRSRKDDLRLPNKQTHASLLPFPRNSFFALLFRLRWPIPYLNP